MPPETYTSVEKNTPILRCRPTGRNLLFFSKSTADTGFWSYRRDHRGRHLNMLGRSENQRCGTGRDVQIDLRGVSSGVAGSGCRSSGSIFFSWRRSGSQQLETRRMTDIKPSDTIGGYRLVESVGQGAMGEVFLGWNPRLQRTVAIKVLRRKMAADPAILKRFLREGKLVAQLDHPGIARVFDLGNEAGFHYIVMEFVQGRDLEQIQRKEGRFACHRALAIARQVAEALGHAHGFGIVHRDVKPSNIVLADDGSARLTDFGIAHLADQETVITQAGEVLGSPAFMSPEQVRGADKVDARSDLYSLGATLYVLLSGGLPFQGNTVAATMHRIVHENPRPLETVVSNLPPSVAALVKRLMAKLPAARFQTGKEFCAAVDEVLQKGSIHLREDHPPEHRPATAAGPSLRAVTGLIAVCALVVGFCFYASDTRESSASSSRPPIGATPIGDSTGDDPDVYDGGTHPEVPDWLDERTQLEERVLAFRDVILSGDETQALHFVVPASRTNPGLVASLRQIVEMVAALGSRVSSQHTLETHERGARVVFFFQQEEPPAIMKFPVNWILQSGSWYAEPEIQ